MNPVLRKALGLCLLMILWGCAAEEAQELSPQEVRKAHTPMFDAVQAYLDRPELFEAGEWQQHFGDGAMFGPSFDLAQWKKTGEQRYYDRGIAALDVNRDLVESATASPLMYLDQIETLAMALLSLIEAGLYLDDAEVSGVYAVSADALMEILDDMATALDDYLEIDQGEFAATTYGPTSLTAFLALMHFEHVLAYPERNPDYHLERGEAVLEAAYKKAWNETLGTFRFAPEDERHMLYPSISMMLAYARADLLTGDSHYRQRFEETYAGIQPLKDPDGDHYHSPYSAEEMGATDDDYCTLSSQNYLMLGLIGAYQNTGDVHYLEEVHAILGFIESKLLLDGRLLHHWVNDRAANDDDPWVYCLGCNFQTLYLLLLVEMTII